MELTEFLAARLDEWESLARQALPLQTGSRDEGQPPGHISWRRNAGHPGFALRHVDTLRKIVTVHDVPEHYCQLPVVPGRHSQLWTPEEGPCWTLRLLAADFSTHPDYDPAWRA